MALDIIQLKPNESLRIAIIIMQEFEKWHEPAKNLESSTTDDSDEKINRISMKVENENDSSQSPIRQTVSRRVCSL